MRITTKTVTDLYLGKVTGNEAQCPECSRVFDLRDFDDANEWNYGHDCEAK